MSRVFELVASINSQQEQQLCVFEKENVTLDLTVYDEDGELLDLTGVSLLWVVWTPPDGTTLVTKSSSITSEILIDADQVTNKGKAQVFLDAPASAGVFRHNLWIDVSASEKHLGVIPSRFEIMIARRS